jgi:RNA polymerase sigma-70 factor (ECF subfamily)
MSAGPESFAEIFRAHERDVRRLCRRLLGDDAAAADALGETFARAQARFDSYDAERPLRSWLFGIASNHCVDVLRRRSTEKRLFDDAEATPEHLSDGGPSPLQQMLQAEARARLLAAVDALPPKYRLPLVLRHFADQDYDAIAAALDVSRNQVATLLFRARRRLRAALSGDDA